MRQIFHWQIFHFLLNVIFEKSTCGMRFFWLKNEDAVWFCFFFQIKSDFTLFLVWFFYYSSALSMQLLAETRQKKIVEFGPETGFLEHCFWWKLKIFTVFAFNLRLKTLTGKYIIEPKNWLKQNLGFFWSFPYIYN